MDGKLLNLAQESIAQFLATPIDRLGAFRALKVYDADRSIFLLRAENCSTAFALKVRKEQCVKEGDLSDSATESEFRKIEAAFAIIRNTSVAADMPVPVALFAEHRAMLTSWCPGTELRRLFYRRAWTWRMRSADLCAHFGRCGTWLAAFHNGSCRNSDAAETSRVRLRHVDRMVAQIADNPGNRLGDHELERVRSVISDSLLGCNRVDVGLLHGNFTLRNILCTPGRAIPVDFEDSRPDATSMDVGQFIADIALAAYRPTIGESALKGSAAAFLSAYRERLPISQERLSGSFLYHVLATYYEVINRDASALVAQILSTRQRYVYSQMLAAPERTCENSLPQDKRF